MNHKASILSVIVFIATCVSLSCFAQLQSTTPPKGITGTFYVSVDDAAKIYVNGQKVHDAGVNESRSAEVELHPADRIVVQLRDDGGGRRFMMIFASSDQKTVVSFRHRDFKVVPDIGVTDFKPEEFQKWPKYAIAEKHGKHLPIKSYSEWIWGDISKCTIAGIVTPEMIKPMPK